MKPSEQYDAAFNAANEAVAYVDARSRRVRWSPWGDDMTHELAMALHNGQFADSTVREAAMRAWLLSQIDHYYGLAGWLARQLVPIIVRLVIEWWHLNYSARQRMEVCR